MHAALARYTLSRIGLDVDLETWVATVLANGGTVTPARKALMFDLIRGSKSVGAWTKCDRFYIVAAENTVSARTDLISRDLMTVNGSPPFVTDRGYTGTDASSTVYANTHFNPTTATGEKFLQNDCHVSVWSATNVTSGASGGALIGTAGSTSHTNLYPKYSDGNCYYRLNDNAGGDGFVSSTSQGHFLAVRTGASAKQCWKNGTSADTGSAPSQAIINQDFAVLGGGPAFASGSACQLSMASIGGSLTSAEVAAWYTVLRTHMTAIGVP